MTFTERFARWAAELRYRGIPRSVRDLAKYQLANLLAASCAGVAHGGEELFSTLDQVSGAGECTVIGGKKAGPVEAAYRHSTYSMLHDYDDYLFMAHSGHGSVFAALAIGELEARSGEELLTAIVIGNELAGRLGGSVLLGPHNGQMWSFVHQATAAVVTSRLLSRDAETVCNALSLALYNPPFPNLAGFMNGHAKYTTASTPTAAGVRAGLLAEDGARGNSSVLSATAGFLNDFAFEPLPVRGGLGEAWVSRSLSFKPYPGCAYLQSPMEALDELDTVENLDTNIIEKITVEGTLPTVMMENHCDANRSSNRLDPTNVAFSVKLALAVRLYAGDFRPRHLSEGFLKEHKGKLQSLARKIDVRHNWERTLMIVGGINNAVDLGALLREVGYFNVLGALRQMRKRHSSLSTGREVMKLLMSGTVMDLPQVLESELNWDRFDISQAQFKDLSFNFGCKIDVETSSGNEDYRVERDRHRAAAGDEAEEKRSMVMQKLQKEAEDFFGSEAEADELQSRVARIDQISVRRLTQALKSE
jgi:2-methylcitrate dehydratase PrpD